MYIKTRGTNDILIVSLYVDNLIFTGNNEKMILEFKKEIMRKYEMSDLGLLHYFLGIEIIQDGNGVLICQKKYCESILKKFRMHGCKSVTTPLVVNEKFMK